MRAAPAEVMLLPVGNRQSLGDSCLNADNALIDTHGMNRILDFDQATGLVVCEPGLSLGSLAKETTSASAENAWFPAVFPGTTQATIAGAIANDVHGKNHSSQGSFCHHVEALTLLRSDGVTMECCDKQNAALFRATMGGLGLTGIIVSATLRLRRVPGPLIKSEEIKCNLNDAALLFADDLSDWEYRFFWFDPFDRKGRGIFTRARHCCGTAGDGEPQGLVMRVLSQLPFPATLGGPAMWRRWYDFALSRAPERQIRRIMYDGGLAPLGSFARWNRLLGPSGLLHMQAVLPVSAGWSGLQELLDMCRTAGEMPCVASVKVFGAIPPRGMLSFPREGITVALDFANAGVSTRRLVRQLQGRVAEVGGIIYPGKDSTLSSEVFRKIFPEWQSFLAYIDPRFSSSFWRRVGGEAQ